MRSVILGYFVGFLLRMVALPVVGGDVGAWGTEMNNFLSVSHDPTTGKILDSALGFTNIVTQTASYTLQFADAGKTIAMNVATANTLTIPSDAGMVGGTMQNGTIITIRQQGAGQTTVTPGAGVTLHSRGAVFNIAGQYGWATLIKVGANFWELTGDIA